MASCHLHSEVAWDEQARSVVYNIFNDGECCGNVIVGDVAYQRLTSVDEAKAITKE